MYLKRYHAVDICKSRCVVHPCTKLSSSTDYARTRTQAGRWLCLFEA
jgi:hypothetical protein